VNFKIIDDNLLMLIFESPLTKLTLIHYYYF